MGGCFWTVCKDGMVMHIRLDIAIQMARRQLHAHLSIHDLSMLNRAYDKGKENINSYFHIFL